MSETTELAVPLSLTSVYGQTGVERLDASWSDRLSEIITYATYRLHFAPLRWLTGLDNLVKAALMFFPGVFLLSQVSATANVKIQLAAVGTLGLQASR